jgi:hypothetical protein
MEFKNVEHVNPNELIFNDEKFNILGTPKNYDELYNSIGQEGILTPLLINESNVVISGNIRLMIALELNLELVPVNYVNIHESDMVKILSTDIYREKSLSEQLTIYFMLKEKSRISKGVRTDIDEDLKKEKQKFQELVPLTEHGVKCTHEMKKEYSESQIVEATKECEKECKNVKFTDVSRKLRSKFHKNSDEINPKMESSIEYEHVIKNERLKEFVKEVNENGGSIFVTNVVSSKDWKLINIMKNVGLILLTFKQITNNNYTYHFIFMKSSNPPLKHLDLFRNMTVVKSPTDISNISIEVNHRLAS